MFKQTETKYKKIMLGFGNESLYNVGCYLVSLVNGLNLKGWNFTPESFNQLLRDKKLFIGEFKNYIDVDNLFKTLPDIFEFYQRVNAWNEHVLTDSLEKGMVVLGHVDARGISGTGTHFVLILKFENGVVTIFDPWDGKEELVTKKYGKYGNILGLRVFGVHPNKENASNGQLAPVEKAYTMLELDKDIPTEIETKYNFKEYPVYDKTKGLGQFEALLDSYEILKIEKETFERLFEAKEKEYFDVTADLKIQLNNVRSKYEELLNKTAFEKIIEGLSDLVSKKQ